jgi:hypothetical protein
MMDGFEQKEYKALRTSAKAFLELAPNANVLILVESHAYVDNGYIMFSESQGYPISLVSPWAQCLN